MMNMKHIFRILHHRSLTASIVALCFAFLAVAFLPEYNYRLQHQGAPYLWQIGITVLSGVVVCLVTFLGLLKDGANGYPSFRCSLATLLWAPACVPIGFLAAVTMKDFV